MCMSCSELLLVTQAARWWGAMPADAIPTRVITDSRIIAPLPRRLARSYVMPAIRTTDLAGSSESESDFSDPEDDPCLYATPPYDTDFVYDEDHLAEVGDVYGDGVAPGEYDGGAEGEEDGE